MLYLMKDQKILTKDFRYKGCGKGDVMLIIIQINLDNYLTIFI